MNRKVIFAAVITCALMLVSMTAWALEHFEATCSDVRVEGYRYDIGTVDGKVYSAWSKNDGFSGPPWRIRYTGGSRAQVDDNEAVVMDENGPILILSTTVANSRASSVWFYAIHRDLKQIVAGEVNGFASLTRGVKARTVQLDCTFKELP